ncbi:Uncharacterised protein [Mycobacteroides abscessus subsp. abscessus]|nr:Uncharacterised protein [Mycobacteroides abscessus subsp. abscessus]
MSRAVARRSMATPRPSSDRKVRRKVVTSSVLARSSRIACATPGYWILTATCWPLWRMARWTWPIDADDIGSSVNCA